MSDREVANVEPTDVEESNSESTESQLQTGISTAEREENPFRNRPLPPLPQPAVNATHCVQIENQNIDEDVDIPYYVEFLEYVDRPIMLEAYVPHNQPCLSPNPRPSTSQTYCTVRDVSEHSLPSTSNLQRNHCSSYLNDDSEISYYYSTREDESPYCDNHCYVPDSDTSDDLHDLHVIEPPQQEQQQQQHQRDQPQQQLLQLQQQQQAEDEQYLYYTILCFFTLSVLYFLRTQS